MGLSTDGKNAMLDSSSDWPPAYISLHSADPGASGTAELTGGTPAYARKAPSWDAASGGSKAIGSAITFDIPAGGTVAYFGFWTASTSGTYLGGAALSATETYVGQGSYTLTSDTVSLS